MPAHPQRPTLLLAALVLSAASALAQTPTYTVTVLTDPATGTAANCTNQALNGATPDASCALRDALAATDALGFTGTAGTQPIVNFAASLTASKAQSIQLGATLNIRNNVNITGPGASRLTIIGYGTTSNLQNAGIFLQQNTGTTASTVSGLTLSGGFVYSSSTSPSVIIGGAAWQSTGTATVTFLNDTISGGAAFTLYAAPNIVGGAISASNVILTGTTVTGFFVVQDETKVSGNAETATGGLVNGGAIFAGNSFTANSSAQANTVIQGNYALLGSGGYAGTVYVGGVASIANATFSSNQVTLYGKGSAPVEGGALYLVGAGAIANTVFSGNLLTSSANNNYATPLLGGALAAVGPGVSITGSSFTSNYVTYTGYGGAIFSSGSLSIQNTSFTSNGSPTTANQTQVGGAIYASQLSVSNTSFSGNAGFIGVVYVNGSATSSIANSLFSANSTSGSTNNPVAAIYADGPLTVTGTTFAGNSGAGVVSQSTVSLYNVTSSGNAIGADLESGSGNSLNVYNSALIDGASGATDKGGNYICSTTCNAMLGALANNGGPTQTLLPLPGSPLIGAAIDTTTNTNSATTDNRGYSRSTTYGSTARVDVGAAQSNYSLAFAQQPTNTTAGTTIAPAPSVQLFESGAAFASSGNSITIQPLSGTLSGTSSVATNSTGLATFSGLSIIPAESSETLTASLTLNAAIPLYLTTTSNPFVISGGSTAQTITFPQPRPGVAGGSATITATTTSGLPVSFSITSGPATVGSTTTTGSGASTVSNATITYTGTGAVTIAANQPGNATYATAATVTNTVQVNANYLWLLNNTGTVTRTTNAAASPTTLGTPGTNSTLGSLAFDSAGNSWSITLANNQLVETNPAATSMSTFTGNNLANPAALAIDGSGLLWIANQGNNSLSLFSNTGTALNPSVEYAKDKITKPTSLVIDAAGGLWITSQGTNSITHLFGAATPVPTPLSNATSNATLGTRP